MSADYASVFKCIDNAVVSLTYRWKIYLELFGSGHDNVALLNASGANVFGLLQTLVLDDAILALSRLTDPATSGPAKENASFKYLIDIGRSIQTPGIIAEADALIAQLEKKVESIRVHRKKALAHADLLHAANPELLPPIEYDTLEAAMQLCRQLVLKLGTPGMHRTGFDVIVPFGKGPLALLAQLKRGRASNGELG